MALSGITDRPVIVTATVCDLPEYDGRYRYPLSIESVDGAPVSGLKVELVSRTALSGELGDRVSGSMTLTPLRQRADGVCARASADGTLAFAAGDSGLRYALTGVRGRLLARLDGMFDGDVRGVVKGVLLGDTVSLDDDLTAAFRACGLSHAVVVSGMHLTVVSGIFLVLLLLLTGFRRRLSAGLALLPTLGFLALTGFAPSALRATVAIVAWLVGILFDEDADVYTSLGWAIIALTIFDPVLPTQPGFLLSCSAVLGLSVLGGRGRRWLDKRYYRRFGRPMPPLLTALASTACVTIGAQLGTLPLLTLYFSRLSAVGLPANLATFFAFSVLLLFGTLGILALALRLDPIGYALFAVAGLAARFCAAVVRGVSRLPGVTVPAWGLWTALCGLITVAVLLVAVARRKTRLGALLCAAVLLLCGVGNTVVSHATTRLVVTESGCLVRDAQGGLSFVGFDKAYRGAYDAARVADAFGAEDLGVVIWDDFSEWNALLRERRAEVLVTDAPVAGAAQPLARQTSGPARLSWHDVVFDRQEAVTCLTLSGRKVVVADGVTTLDALPDADVWILPAPYGETDAPRLVVKRGLAPDERDVYNENGCDYILTVWPNGRIFIEKG